MLFNSFVFVAFMAVVLPVYYRLRHRWQNAFLLAASYVFYGYWDWRFTALLAPSTAVDFFVAQGIASTESTRRRRYLLLCSLAVNLGVLGFFKYFDFFVESALVAVEQFGFTPNVPLRVVLPMGISFYTFQTLAYTIDVYRGNQQPTRDPVAFAVYVSYFPQLVAGPIERASRLLPQIAKPRRVGPEQWATAAQLLLWGYVKKVVIADGLDPYVAAAFSSPESMQGWDLLLALYAFAFQIYCDFSGYSDIARGISRLFGIQLMENFRQPYLSRNITEFWRRWHISLSTWLRDYLYIPLGGNRQGPFRQYLNLCITMLLGGLWHGASWHFVAWGALHGLYLAVHKWLNGNRKIGQESPPTTLAQWATFVVQAAVTFHLVCLAWVLFRAESLTGALDYLSSLLGNLASLGLTGAETQLPGAAATVCFSGVVLLLLDLGCWLSDGELSVPPRIRWWVRGLIYGLGLLILAFVREPLGETFIYFQF